MPQKFPRYPASPTPPAYTPNYPPDLEYPDPRFTPELPRPDNDGLGVILLAMGAVCGGVMVGITVLTLMLVL